MRRGARLRATAGGERRRLPPGAARGLPEAGEGTGAAWGGVPVPGRESGRGSARESGSRAGSGCAQEEGCRA